MATYILFDNLKVNDTSKLEDYKSRVAPVVRKFGGKYVVMGGKTEVLEGLWQPTHLVMLEFPSYELAKHWYDSEDYRTLKALRLSAMSGTGVLIEGL